MGINSKSQSNDPRFYTFFLFKNMYSLLRCSDRLEYRVAIRDCEEAGGIRACFSLKSVLPPNVYESCKLPLNVLEDCTLRPKAAVIEPPSPLHLHLNSRTVPPAYRLPRVTVPNSEWSAQSLNPREKKSAVLANHAVRQRAK